MKAGNEWQRTIGHDPDPVRTERERILAAIGLMGGLARDGPLRVLGTGYESVVLTDENTVYKVFERSEGFFSDLIEKIKGRFDGRKRFINGIDLIEIGGRTVIAYPFIRSEPYLGGRKDEIEEFLVESALMGIVIKDVKPLNFRVFPDGLKFIDYGRDIAPFNHKDFLFMAQRAFLTMNGWANPEFKNLTRKAIHSWDLPELEGFFQFYDEVHKRAMDAKGSSSPLETVEVSEDLWTIRAMNDFFGPHEWRVIAEMPPRFEAPVPHHFHPLSELSAMPSVNRVVLFADDNRTLDTGTFETIRGKMSERARLGVFLKNPYFSEDGAQPLKAIERSMEGKGFKVIRTTSSPARPDSNANFYSSSLFIESEAFTPVGGDVSLVIKACYQDGDVLERLVEHIVAQSEQPDHFLERIVVMDSKEGDFLRPYSESNKVAALRSLETLKDRGVIDAYHLSPIAPDEVSAINERWFGLRCENAHCVRNIPVVPQLYAFELCKGRYILQTDCDSIVVRRDQGHQYLNDMKQALRMNENALSVSFNICHPPRAAPRGYESPGGGRFVPEVRFCLMDKERLLNGRPYPNSTIGGRLKLTWYRSIELAQDQRDQVSLRGGDPTSFYIHPPNTKKKDKDQWFRILDRAEAGFVPSVQSEHVDLQGEGIDWSGPKREEDFIFVICGKDLSNRKFLRCWQSVINQTREDWGAVIVNDGSKNGLHDYIMHAIERHSDRVTYLNNPRSESVLPNIYHAIRDVCTNPYSVIVILDMDDMLLSNDFLASLRIEYLKGSEMVLGKAIRMGRGVLPYEPDLKGTRSPRLGDVGTHPRTFRKYLFDAIDDNDFKIDGAWADKFTELTYTVPMSEMAKRHSVIRWPLYLWEPAHLRDEEHYRRNGAVTEWMSGKQPYEICRAKRDFPDQTIPPGRLLLSMGEGKVTFIRHAEKERRPIEFRLDNRTSVRGREEAIIWGRAIPFDIDLYLTSTVQRTAETAWCVRKGNGTDSPIVHLRSLGGLNVRDRGAWEMLKREHGFLDLIDMWVDGEVPPTIVDPHPTSLLNMLEDIMKEVVGWNAKTPLVVTHDHVILTLHRTFHRSRQHRIPYLGGFSVTIEELLGKISELRGMQLEQ